MTIDDGGLVPGSNDIFDLAVTVAKQVLEALRASSQTLATAESLTCGLLAGTVASVPGASAVLRGGLAAYATDVKTSVLGVDRLLIAEAGVVSAPCAEAMAVQARRLFGADWSLSTTGVAGPDPQDGHPVGEVYVAVAGPGGGVDSARLDLPGSRQEIRLATVLAALNLLAERLP